ncbi:MAG TPA: hypothetical protein VM490_08235 [Armatimonadaceae bacterium]|jgi:hypothetical protein|nr:hypothetical protein [Armatimonadaceae bacterium]
MTRTAHKTAAASRAAALAFAAVAGFSMVAAPLALSAKPAVAAQEPDTAPARDSRAAAIALPAGMERVNGALPAVAKLLEPIQGDAKEFGNGRIEDGEVLGWDFDKPGAPSSHAAAKQKLIAALRAAGYAYDEVGAIQKDNPAGPIRHFYARSPKTGKRLLGYWIDAKTSQILVWARLAGGGAPQVAKAPASLIGPTWRSTRISASTFWSQSGAYVGDGAQQATMITFNPDGTYKLHGYSQSRAGDWGLQAYTWEEGKASFDGDLVVLRPTGGKYKGVDTKLAHKNFERAMTADEMRANVRLYRWQMTDADGKPVLKMGNGSSDQATFKPTNG